ncbi:hypothetical protein ACN08L_18400 [Photobacterium leiognathi subsp. mandapamensis]|uniref:hypothetical protein n=1 Tax=Photobacterium leiognathi TaxID=553611 RepID=UPI003AF3B702
MFMVMFRLGGLFSMILPSLVYADSPPKSPTSMLHIESHRTPVSDSNSIYANGRMQSPLLVTYQLKQGYINPRIRLREKYVETELPAKDGWTVSTKDNGFDYYINDIGSTLSALAVKSGDPRATTQILYVSNTSQAARAIKICVELTATENATGNDVTKSTCGTHRSNKDIVTVVTRKPTLYQLSDFTVDHVHSDSDEDAGGYRKKYGFKSSKVYARYYELRKKNYLSRDFKLKGVGVRTPTSVARRVYAFADYSQVSVSRDGKAFFVEILSNDSKYYVSNDPEGMTSFSLKTIKSSMLIISKIAIVYGHDLRRRAVGCSPSICVAWPYDGQIRDKSSKLSITLYDNYGTAFDMNFTLKDWHWYINNTKIW